MAWSVTFGALAHDNLANAVRSILYATNCQVKRQDVLSGG